MTKPIGERMAVLETQVKQISNDVAEVKSDVGEVRTHQTENHKSMQGSIDTLIATVDGRFHDHESRIRIVEDTTEPFTKFKKRLWTIIVVSLLSATTVALLISQIQNLL